MRGSFRIARVKGIDIRVHFTFALLLLWAMFDWGLGRGLGWAGAFYGVIFFVLLFACVTLHELAHSLVARHFGATVHDITLLPIGGLARLEGEPERPMHEFWMAIAGPLTNLVIGGALGVLALPWFGWRALSGLEALLTNLRLPGLDRLLLDLVIANVGLAVFNLLPAFPMDGGRVLRSLLASQMGDLSATRIAKLVGQGLAGLLGVVGLVTGALNLVLIAVFIFFGAEQEWRGVQMRVALRRIPARAALSGPTTVLAPHEPLRRAIDVTLRRPSANFAVFEGGRLVGVLTRADVANAFRRYGPDVAVARVMRTEFPVAQAGDSLLDLERRMRRSGSPLVSLVEGGRFLGLVTLESVRRALRLSPVR